VSVHVTFDLSTWLLGYDINQDIDKRL